VLISAGQGDDSVQATMDALWNSGVKVNSIVAFDFTLDQGAASDLAIMVAHDNNPNGNGLGREFLNAIKGAEGVWFLGGDQWRYVQLFKDLVNHVPTYAAQQIAAKNNGNQAVVGGTSAGLAILGDYVYASQYGGISSEEILDNLYSTNYVRNNQADIQQNIFNLSELVNVITETHFTDPGKQDFTRYYRLGRYVSFLATIDAGIAGISPNASIHGLAVDDGTALWVDSAGNAQVLGMKQVWFAFTQTSPLFSPPISPPLPVQIDFFSAGLNVFHSGQSLSLSNAWINGANSAIVEIDHGKLIVPQKLPFPVS
jgi:cyanophycinase-like exopeptidase